MGSPKYAAVAVLRGELGTSSVVKRDMLAKLKYLRCVILGEFGGLMRDIFQDMYEKMDDKLAKTVQKYMNIVGINGINELILESECSLVNRINESDKSDWYDEMRNKSTLSIYRQYKKEIKQERIYDNNWESILLFRARSCSLNLCWRERDIRVEMVNAGSVLNKQWRHWSILFCIAKFMMRLD